MEGAGQYSGGVGEYEMTTSTIDESQRKAAKVAGFAFLSAIAIVAIGQEVHPTAHPRSLSREGPEWFEDLNVLNRRPFQTPCSIRRG